MSTISFRRLGLLTALIALALGLALDARAQANVAQVNSLLQRAESNLQSVASSVAGRTSPPAGSAGKLLANRLQQALSDLTPAKALLDKIPAGTTGRDEAVARYEAAAGEHARLQTFLTGSAAPAPVPSGGTRLNYQQEELLKNAAFSLREVQGNAERLAQEFQELSALDDQLAIDFRHVEGLMGLVANAQRKAGFARDSLVQLPADGAGVADVQQALEAAEASVAQAAAYLAPLQAQLRTLIDPASHPEFEADRRRLQDLSAMFANPEVLVYDRPLAAATVAQAEAAMNECIRIAQKYARLIQQQTDQGKYIEGTGNGFLENHAEFLAEAETAKLALPDEIREDIRTALQLGSEAVREQKPAWFTGGIPQTLGYAEERILLLTALDEAAGKAMQAELDEAKKELETQAEALREFIIRENKPVEDRFQGDDRDEAIKVATSAWKVQQEEFEVVAVRIRAEQWVRETKWTYSNGTWYFSDMSKLQVRLYITDHENPDLVIDRPVNVWKDHQAGDSMSGTPVFAFEDVLQPGSYLLKANVKP